MSQSKDLLVEIGTEELPPKSLKRLSEAFSRGIAEGFAKAGLNHQGISEFATPRRLAVVVQQLEQAQPDKEVQRRGPALGAAFGEDGCPTPAAQGFAKSCGVSVDDLERMENKNGAWLVFNSKQKGQPSVEIIPGIITEALDKLPIPKRMRWGALSAQFVRPVHWVVILFGEQLIRAEILSVKTTSQTRGHRFHHPEAINLAQPSEYESGLEAANVIASFEKRRARVREQVEQAARTLKGTAVIDTDLLDEVTSMVEWPVAVVGDFEHRFLEVPQEALITTMKDNQKYFYVVDGEGKLLPHFITISNIESRDPAKVKQGNERVVRPRFEDANFFWKQDRKHPLAANLERLQTVVFQNKLGSLYDKVQRSAGLAELIAQALHANVEWAKRAALLSKCDLMSEMVGEFPGLQGIMGRYYAQHDGEPGEVPQALDELYMPRFAGDALPVTATGQVVATADRLDTLAGIFAIGEIPSGDKDPFALRRAALGALRIMIEKQLPLNLLELLQAAARNYTKTLKIDATALANTVFDFMMERLRTYYLDTGVLPDVFDAVLAQRPVLPLDFDRRVKAVSAFRALPEAASLAAANKRIANILKKIDSPPTQLDHKRLSEDAEIRLAKQLTAMTAQVDPLFAAGDYQQALTQLAGLRESVDSFFDHVMVMTDDRVLRDNRVALLGNLRNLFLRVADLSCLQH